MKRQRALSELNIVSIIDNMIMELTYAKKGQLKEINKIKEGLEVIEDLISFYNNSRDNKFEERVGLKSFQEKKYFKNESYRYEEYSNELNVINESIKKILAEYQNKNLVSEIEIVQKLLLKVSIPIWKNEIAIIKQNKY